MDHYGLLGNPKAFASPLRLLSAGLMIASVLVVVYAKHSEVRNDTGHGEPETDQTAPLENDF